jgi:maltose O-acetyltransferase
VRGTDARESEGASPALSRRLGVREFARRVVTGYLVPSEYFPESLIFSCLRAVGLDVAEPCGLRCARLQTDDLSIGRGTWANRGLYVEGRGRVAIGAGVLIGPEVLIVTSTHERDESGAISAESSYAPVTIGDRCWIGARVVILPGVRVFDDVTIAAGAVVASDIGPGGLYGGVPARKLR